MIIDGMTITAEEFIRGCMAEGLILRVDSGEVRIYGGNLKSRNEAAEVLAELNQSTAIEDDVLYELTAERDKYGLPYDNALEWALRDKTAAAMKLAELLREQGRADLLTVLEMRYWSWASWYQIANALNTSWPKVEKLDAELLSIAKNSGLFAEECGRPARIGGTPNEGTETNGAYASEWELLTA